MVFSDAHLYQCWLSCLYNVEHIINTNYINKCNYHSVQSWISCTLRTRIYVLATIIDWWAKVTWLHPLFLINIAHILICFVLSFTIISLTDVLYIENKDKTMKKKALINPYTNYTIWYLINQSTAIIEFSENWITNTKH